MINKTIKALCEKIEKIESNGEKIKVINEVKKKLHEISPFKNEPVDCVLWVDMDNLEANDYNPNSVAPPEMELLYTSILNDGYTQPIVAFDEEKINDKYIVIDGFHRNRVGREFEDIKSRVHGYLPITIINSDREDRGDRIAATIRHNRARGKHQVTAMSDIVMELKRRCWNDEKISKQLGMDSDEVLRLCQITGLTELFKNDSFSTAWEPDTDTDVELIENENI